jgi:hypothetical protein
VLRFLIGLLVGIIVGVGATAYFFAMGGGDHLISASPRVLRLEEDLRRVAQERDQITKKLEDTTARIERITTAFSDLERRFQHLENLGQKPAAEASHGAGQGETSSSQP